MLFFALNAHFFLMRTRWDAIRRCSCKNKALERWRESQGRVMVFPVNVTHSWWWWFDPCSISLTQGRLLLEGQGGHTRSQWFLSFTQWFTLANVFFPHWLTLHWLKVWCTNNHLQRCTGSQTHLSGFLIFVRIEPATFVWALRSLTIKQTRQQCLHQVKLSPARRHVYFLQSL